MKVSCSTKRATADRLAKLPLTQTALAEAERFCRSYNLSLDKIVAEGIECTVRGCLEDDSNMAYHLKHSRLKGRVRSIFDTSETDAASLIAEAAQLHGELRVNVAFELEPETFRVLLSAAAESGANLGQLVETAINRMVQDRPVFTLPKLRNS